VISALLASGGSLDFGAIFLDLALILIIAKAAAEVSERVGIPAVIGEIVAGIMIGPSLLGLVEPSDAIRVLAEVGVIILLAEVGLEMDLDELRKVGRASVLVAVIGVAVPMSSGFFAGSVLGESVNASLFLGAALAATSVGITARVFGDLKALSSTEARIVLGAAVADDVMGLVILTIVTRIVEQGSVDVGGLVSTIGLASGFLLVAGAVGILLVPRLLSAIGTRALSPVTIGVIAAGITFGFSAAASAANLAPIIGAFVAGAALGRSSYHDRIARDFAAIGAVFIPVFFMLIGMDTDVTKFFDLRTLGIAAVLSAIAIGGKMVAAVGAGGTNADKLLIGMGMVPRGEVGLIFATIGVSVGVFNDDLYSVVLLVVLVTTVAAPPMLRWRITQLAHKITTTEEAIDVVEPVGGWIVVIKDEVRLQGNPPSELTLRIGLEAALRAAHAQPSESLNQWLHTHRHDPVTWDHDTTDQLIEVLLRGTPRSWRLLDATGIIERALPEIAQAISQRRDSTLELDPLHHTEMPTVEKIRTRISASSIEESALLLAAFVTDFSDTHSVISVVDRLALPNEVPAQVRSLVYASRLLYSAAAIEPFVSDPRTTAQLASYLGTPELVEKCRLLTEARGDFNEHQYAEMINVITGVQQLLAHPELIEGMHQTLENVRRSEALELAGSLAAKDRIENTTMQHLLAYEPATLARHASLVEPVPSHGKVRVEVSATSANDMWMIDIATRDQRGLLARLCVALVDEGLEITSAAIATWADGAVLDTFTVRCPIEPDAYQIARAAEKRLATKLSRSSLPDATTTSHLKLTLDNNSNPWNSIVVATGVDQPGVLQAIATAFAQARIDVHHARINTDGSAITDRFEVTTSKGRKITPQMLDKVSRSLSHHG
jgi:Kef-type K+ transport system membrane component KefB/predicted amino acid-binding ACT domain protein